MTKREKLIISAYTGTLMVAFDDYHKYVQEVLGRPVFTHEFASKELHKEVRKRVYDDFIGLCEVNHDD